MTPVLRATAKGPGFTLWHRGGSDAEKAKAAQREIIQAFLEHGVSPKLKDANGKSVLDWAWSDWIRQMLAGEN